METTYAGAMSIINVDLFCRDHIGYATAYVYVAKRRHETISRDELLSEFFFLLTRLKHTTRTEKNVTSFTLSRLVHRSIKRIMERWYRELRWKIIISGLSLKRYRQLFLAGRFIELREYDELAKQRITSEVMRREVASATAKDKFDHALAVKVRKLVGSDVADMLAMGFTMRQIGNSMGVSHTAVIKWIEQVRSELKA